MHCKTKQENEQLIALCAAALTSADDPSSGAFECAWNDLSGELKKLIEEEAGL